MCNSGKLAAKVDLHLIKGQKLAWKINLKSSPSPNYELYTGISNLDFMHINVINSDLIKLDLTNLTSG